MKKVIGIDINEVLRSRSMQFDRFYAQEFGEEGCPPEDDPYKFDLRNDYVWVDGEETTKFLNEDLPDNISPMDYAIDEETGEAPVDSLAFKPETKMVTADEKYKRFMYEDFLFEIHGSAAPIYKGMDKDVEKFYKQYKNQFEIKIVSKENWFSIPPTLFFLSKLMPRIKHFSFVETNEEIWDSVDILLTTDPELINRPTDKRVVKITRPYNDELEADFDALQVIDLVDNKDFQKLIGFETYGDDLSSDYVEDAIIDKE
jgi:hypothetical protein